jgi:hypothetical protein
MDELPLQVCVSCVEQVIAACKLFARVSDADTMLTKRYYVPPCQSESMPQLTAKKDPLTSTMNAIGM